MRRIHGLKASTKFAEVKVKLEYKVKVVPRIKAATTRPQRRPQRARQTTDSAAGNGTRTSLIEGKFRLSDLARRVRRSLSASKRGPYNALKEW